MNAPQVLWSTPPAPDLVERLSAALAVDRPWHRITDWDRAALYFPDRALHMLAQAYAAAPGSWPHGWRPPSPQWPGRSPAAP